MSTLCRQPFTMTQPNFFCTFSILSALTVAKTIHPSAPRVMVHTALAKASPVMGSLPRATYMAPPRCQEKSDLENCGCKRISGVMPYWRAMMDLSALSVLIACQAFAARKLFRFSESWSDHSSIVFSPSASAGKYVTKVKSAKWLLRILCLS